MIIVSFWHKGQHRESREFPYPDLLTLRKWEDLGTRLSRANLVVELVSFQFMLYLSHFVCLFVCLFLLLEKREWINVSFFSCQQFLTLSKLWVKSVEFISFIMDEKQGTDLDFLNVLRFVSGLEVGAELRARFFTLSARSLKCQPPPRSWGQGIGARRRLTLQTTL